MLSLQVIRLPLNIVARFLTKVDPNIDSFTPIISAFLTWTYLNSCYVLQNVFYGSRN